MRPIFIIFWAALSASLTNSPVEAQSYECTDTAVWIGTPESADLIHVEIAQTPHARAKGLMGRQTMPANAGMLFVFDDEKDTAFWMKNTPLPLDIIFINHEGRIKHIHKNARPFDETPIFSQAAVKYALEINAGGVDALDVKIGDYIRHPLIETSKAAWPCP